MSTGVLRGFILPQGPKTSPNGRVQVAYRPQDPCQGVICQALATIREYATANLKDQKDQRIQFRALDMINYTIDRSCGLIRVMTNGASTFTDLIRHLANLNDDPEFDPNYNTIFHIAEDATLPNSFLIDLLKTILEQWEQHRTGTMWAVVLPSNFHLRLAQLAAQSVDLRSVELEFFDDEEGAIAWLNATVNLQHEGA
jgi:hypothetical protein